MRARTWREAWEAQVDRLGADDCWPWRGTFYRLGYGSIKAEGKRSSAHRIAWALANGRTPIGVVRHTCDNRWCQNPAHLLEGTQAENVQDRVLRHADSWQKGEAHGCAKLTDEAVRSARLMHGAGRTFTDLAAEFGVSRSAMTNAITGRTWSHL